MNKRYFRVILAAKDLRPFDGPNKRYTTNPILITEWITEWITEAETETEAAEKMHKLLILPQFQWLWTEVTESDLLSFMMATTFSGDKAIRVLSPLNENIHLK